MVSYTKKKKKIKLKKNKSKGRETIIWKTNRQKNNKEINK